MFHILTCIKEHGKIHEWVLDRFGKIARHRLGFGRVENKVNNRWGCCRGRGDRAVHI